MNVFRLTKRALVATTSFSKLKNKSTSSPINRDASTVWAHFFKHFFTKKEHFFSTLFSTILGLPYMKREDVKYGLITFWMSLRVKIAPVLWLMRDTFGILTSHVKATILPFLWHVRYVLMLKKTLFKGEWRMRNGESISESASFSTVHFNKSVIYTPSVKTAVFSEKETFLSIIVGIKQLFKAQSLRTNLISIALLVAFCSVIYVKSEEQMAAAILATPSVKMGKNGVTVREFQKVGKIKKTLYTTLVESGVSHDLIDMVEDALKNKLPIKQCVNGGGEYKLIWEEEQTTREQQLTCVYFNGQCVEDPVHVFYYNNSITSGWFDKKGLPVRNEFIESPVKNSIITSRYNPNRKHPILGYRRAHLGTDYAAPRGSPIMSVADGVVEEARYRMGNGRYVKIKHIAPYETEYLHMSKFAYGIEKGATVRKKQVIGYVGMSGLTTGPHVCFRFWKDGMAIDPLSEHFFTDADNTEYQKLVAEKMVKLDKMTAK